MAMSKEKFLVENDLVYRLDAPARVNEIEIRVNIVNKFRKNYPPDYVIAQRLQLLINDNLDLLGL